MSTLVSRSTTAPSNNSSYFLSTHNALQGSLSDFTVRVFLQEKNGGRHTMLTVYPFHDVELIKRLLITQLDLPPNTNSKDLCLYYGNTLLPNNRNMEAFCRRCSRVRLTWQFKERDAGYGIRLVNNYSVSTPSTLCKLICEIQLGMQRGIVPKLTDDGTGGTYILCNSERRPIALFKPRDEEPFTPNNPRGHTGRFGTQGFRQGVLSGEGAVREVAAYMLNAQSCFTSAGVPLTCEVEASHRGFNCVSGEITWKKGSLQLYIPSTETASDFDCRMFSVRDVQRIAIMDIRVMNLDRNDGNILVVPACNSQDEGVMEENIGSRLNIDGRMSRYRLVPIDHGLILPSVLDVNETDLAWYHWPHVKIPTTKEGLRCIYSLDPDRDARRLEKRFGLRKECLLTMRVSVRLLQIATKMHFTLHQITSLICRNWEFPDQLSEIEKLIHISVYHAYIASHPNSPSSNLQTIVLDLETTSSGPRKFYGTNRGSKRKNDPMKMDSIDDKQLPAYGSIVKENLLDSCFDVTDEKKNSIKRSIAVQHIIGSDVKNIYNEIGSNFEDGKCELDSATRSRLISKNIPDPSAHHTKVGNCDDTKKTSAGNLSIVDDNCMDSRQCSQNQVNDSATQTSCSSRLSSDAKIDDIAVLSASEKSKKNDIRTASVASLYDASRVNMSVSSAIKYEPMNESLDSDSEDDMDLLVDDLDDIFDLDDGVQFSRLSGAPIDSTAFIAPCLKKFHTEVAVQKSEKLANSSTPNTPSNKNSNASPAAVNISRGYRHAHKNLDVPQRLDRTTAIRRHRRVPLSSKSSATKSPSLSLPNANLWSLVSTSGKSVAADWGDQQFERAFFDIFLSNLQRFLRYKFEKV